jgi:hypothetical protein
MPLYYFQAADSTEIEGKCQLPDDASAVRFAEEIASQMTANNSSGAYVAVHNEKKRKFARSSYKSPRFTEIHLLEELKRPPSQWPLERHRLLPDMKAYAGFQPNGTRRRSD